MRTYQQLISSEKETAALAGRLAQVIQAPCVIYLEGNLGAGKTSFTRSFLKSLGYKDIVRSPTYTLVEEYPINGLSYFHFDLYRLSDPEELEFIGVRDYLGGNSVALIEWPEKGKGILPEADLVFKITAVTANERDVELLAATNQGEKVLNALLKG